MVSSGVGSAGGLIGASAVVGGSNASTGSLGVISVSGFGIYSSEDIFQKKRYLVPKIKMDDFIYP